MFLPVIWYTSWARACASLRAVKHIKTFNKTGINLPPSENSSISCIETRHVFCGLCQQHSRTARCSCSICYRSIQQTRLIAQTQQQGDHTWEREHPHTEASTERPRPQIWQLGSTSWKAAQSRGLHPFVDGPIFALCSLFSMPFLHNLCGPLEGRGFTTGLGSMNRCVVLSQCTILFSSPQVGMISGTQTGGKQSRIHNLFPHLTPAAGSSPTFICSKTGGVWG